MNNVTVLGSINLDTTIRMHNLPKPGETVHSYEVFKNGGGKGANQAIACKRSGSNTFFIGCVGNDDSGKLLTDLLSEDDIDISGLSVLNNEVTGTAIVMVDDNGENSIIINSGSNGKIKLDGNNNYELLIKNSDFLISQFEINLDAITKGFKVAKKYGVKTILNPAPAIKSIPIDILKHTDIFIPNQTEAELITGIKINNEDELLTASKIIQSFGVDIVIITLGEKGSFYLVDDEFGIINSWKVKAVDSTAAGDTFIGALSSILEKDFSNLKEAISYASKAASITVQRSGAQSSIPFANEIF